MKIKSNDTPYCACITHGQINNDYEIIEVMVLHEDGTEHVETDERLHQSCATCGKQVPYYPEEDVIILVCKKINPTVTQ